MPLSPLRGEAAREMLCGPGEGDTVGHRHDNLIANARQLRIDSPLPERLLWSRLRNRQLLGLKFRRQYPIGPFITDFCCFEHRLIIEIDGASHEFSTEADEKRTQWLASQGYRVIRFSNDAVLENVDHVIGCLMSMLMPPPPSPPTSGGSSLPAKGEGSLLEINHGY